LYGNLADK
jgi:hypothetical protein